MASLVVSARRTDHRAGDRADGAAADNWPDVDDLVALNADRDVMSGHSDGLPMSAARVLAEEMPRLMAHNNRTDQLGYWVARDSATGGFLGWFAAVPSRTPTAPSNWTTGSGAMRGVKASSSRGRWP